VPIDVGVVGQRLIGGHQVLFRQSSSSARGHGPRDGRTERVGSVTGLLHDQGEGVRGLLILVLGSVPGCQIRAQTSAIGSKVKLAASMKLTTATHVIRSGKSFHLFGQGACNHETQLSFVNKESSTHELVRHAKLTEFTRSHGAALVLRASRSAEGCTDPGGSDKVGLVVAKRVGVGSTKRQLPGLGVLETKSFPVEQLGETLGPVSLVDTLTTGLGRERQELVGLRRDIGSRSEQVTCGL
jgi:hypothetical protein